MDFDDDRELDISPRVNSKRLAEFRGKTVRLPCKVLQLNGERQMVVEASDGGHINIKYGPNHNIGDAYIEVVGKVIDSSTLQVLGIIGMGEDLDMKLVNDAIELIHDPRFFSKIFS